MRTARKTRKPSSHKTPDTGGPNLTIVSDDPTNAALETFLRLASHELSNVLGTVLGELDYGLSNPNPTVKTRAMVIALQATERARSLARNLSYFALHGHVRPQVTNMSQLASDTVDMCQMEFNHRRVKAVVNVESGQTALTDGGAAQQVLHNIFRRCLSTMPQGGQITLQLKPKGPWLELQCKDNGVGIPAQRLDALLSPPTESDWATRKSDPNDLELFVAKALMIKLHGEFAVQSEIGVGTTYTLKFPTADRTSKTNPLEQRRHRRVGTVLPVEVSFAGLPPFHAQVHTLSVGGCSIEVADKNVRLPPQETVGALRIYYYQDHVLDIHRCRIANADTNTMGIEFLEVDAKAEKILRAIVSSHGL